MMEGRLQCALEPVAARYRRLRCWTALAAAWLIASLIGLAVWSIGRVTGTGYALSIPAYSLLTAGLAGFGLLRALRSPRPDWLARQIETVFPELRSSLLAAIEQRPDLPDGRFGYLQSSVIQESLRHSREHEWRSVVPARRMAAAVLVQFGTLALFITALMTLRNSPTLASAASKKPEERVTGQLEVVVEPGDVEIERGTSLLVLARIKGPVPAEATLHWQPAEGESATLPMSLALGDPVFAARVPDVSAPLEYHVALEGFESPMYHVSVFDYPRLDKLDAKLVFPEYTHLAERLVQDVRTLSVVEGTQATLICRLNKRVAKAEWAQGDKAPPIELVSVDDESAVYQATILCDRSRRLSLALVDESGRANQQKVDLSIQVIPSKPPTIKPTFPARDVEVSALEELEVKATAFDDFGLIRAGVTYGLAEAEPVEMVLAENSAAREKRELAHTIRLEDLHAEQDQLLSYHFWAEDMAADGSIRRTESDMYFAEVRPFDEIFRQGSSDNQQQQQGNQQQGSQNANAAQELAKLQKEIMNATWKLIRRELGSKTTPEFPADTNQVAESQGTARQQAERLGTQLQDPQSQLHLAMALESMQKAIDQLKAAHDQLSNVPLHPALSAEQSAYQSLLKLRAREHEIVRQQSRSQSGQASAARSQQQRAQMNQLEMKEDENRYETQRLARSQNEDQADRENRQVLNRLSELARRQHDLNERLKELQSALAEAKTPEQREEAKRQLQRLQDEQQQMLRDTDELQARMENEQNLERMADERSQIEQTREEIRRATEALEREKVSQATAAGTRAESELDSLRNEFRQRASGRFNEDMQEMRNEARELERREHEIAAGLNPKEEPTQGARSLRDENNREGLEKEFTEQRQRLSALSEKMKQTIQEAEQNEPLLSERLYDAARQLQSSNTEGALKAAENSFRRGLVDDAREQEKIAGEGVRKLREGIEKAADSVLGDETESLRRARDELRNLSEELNREVGRNLPPQEAGAEQGRESSQRGQQPGRSSQSGEQNRQEDATSQNPGDSEQNGGEGRRPGEGRQGRRLPEGYPGSRSQPEERQPGQQNERQQPDPQQGEGQEGQSQEGQAPNGQRPEGQSQQGQSRSTRQSRQQGQGQGQQAGDPSQQGNPGQQGNASQQTQQQGDPSQQQGQRGSRSAPGRQAGDRNPQSGTPRPGRPNANAGAAPGAGEADDFNQRITSPLGGNDFLDWSDRLRDVEEMVGDPELRAEAARIRDRARSLRAESRRHSAPPNWELVQSQVAGPLVELSRRVSEELLRRNSKKAVVPLDRDAVPPRHTEKTRQYYERLGSGQ